MKAYLTKCSCGLSTSRAYARKNGGKCKPCVTGVDRPVQSNNNRNGRMLDAGWLAYAREEGHYDLPDYA